MITLVRESLAEKIEEKLELGLRGVDGNEERSRFVNSNAYVPLIPQSHIWLSLQDEILVQGYYLKKYGFNDKDREVRFHIAIPSNMQVHTAYRERNGFNGNRFLELLDLGIERGFYVPSEKEGRIKAECEDVFKLYREGGKISEGFLGLGIERNIITLSDVIEAKRRRVLIGTQTGDYDLVASRLPEEVLKYFN